MVEASILMTWGVAYVGRETLGMQLFSEVLSFYEAAKASGRLVDFRVGMAESGNVSSLFGYIVAEGTAAQVQAMLAAPDFKVVALKAAHIVPFSISTCATGAGLTAGMERLIHAREQLGMK